MLRIFGHHLLKGAIVGPVLSPARVRARHAVERPLRCDHSERNKSLVAAWARQELAGGVDFAHAAVKGLKRSPGHLLGTFSHKLQISRPSRV